MRIENSIYYIWCDKENLLLDLGVAYRYYRKLHHSHNNCWNLVEGDNMGNYYIDNLFRRTKRKQKSPNLNK